MISDAEYQSMMRKLDLLEEAIKCARLIPQDQFRTMEIPLPEHWFAIGPFFVIPRSAVEIPDDDQPG